MVQLITILTILFTLLAPKVYAQDGEPYKRGRVIKTYRTCMKDKNFAQARQVLTDAIHQYPQASADPQLRKYQVDAINSLIGEENRKLYLGNRPDTVTYFNHIYDLYTAAFSCDSVEQQQIALLQSNGKKATPRLRSSLQTLLLPYRANLLAAGKFHYRKKDYPNAYRFFDRYVTTKTAPIFIDTKGTSLVADPDDLSSVAVLAVLSAYASEQPQEVMTYLSAALRDEEFRPQMLEIGSKTTSQLGDTAQQVQYLRQGFNAYPDTEYFFITLVRHYNDHQLYDEALQCTQRMISLHPLRRDYWYMAGAEQQQLQLYDKAILSYRKCIEIRADDAEAYAALGGIYLHQAHEAYARFDLPRKHPLYTRQRNAITQLYQQACAAYEQARHFDEANTALWLEGLREAYFKLNRGKALKSLEKFK